MVSAIEPRTVAYDFFGATDSPHFPFSLFYVYNKLMSHYIVHALKYATLTLAAAVLVIAAAALLKGTETSSLSGRLVAPQQNDEIPTVHFTAARAKVGYSIPPDTHVLITIPNNVRMPRITFLHGPDGEEIPYWGYCYSNREAANKAAGKIGNDIYDGQFFYSLAERKAQEAKPQPTDSSLLGILNSRNQETPQARASIAEIFHSGQTCYVMTSRALAAGLDTDGDGFNNWREKLATTDPKNPDTDNDGIGDGSEVFVTKTAPLDNDTDHDGLGDRCEDKNTNGNTEQSETSALVADTDRDGLCDGNPQLPHAEGCPEEKETVCGLDQLGQRVCESKLTTQVFGEDMDGDCDTGNGETNPRKYSTFGGINDWDYKWRLLGGLPNPGKVAPLFPIPDMPAR